VETLKNENKNVVFKNEQLSERMLAISKDLEAAL
jgi:hypothetical protein